MIAVLSVESTGTHFVAAVVSKLLGEKAGWADADDPKEIQMAHVYPLGFEETDLCGDLLDRAEKVVVPLRHPVSALISNADRGLRKLPFRDHAKAFGRIAGWRERENVHFFQIDGEKPNRTLETQRLAMFLGVEPAEIAWKHLNQTPPRFHTAARALFRAKNWPELDVLLDGALQTLCEARDFIEWAGYKVEWC